MDAVAFLAARDVTLPSVPLGGQTKMGQCDLCGGNAGLFKTRHPGCEAKAESLKMTLHNLVFEGAQSGRTFDEIHAQVAATVGESGLPINCFAQTMLEAANDAATQIALKAPIPEDELARVVDLLTGFGFPQADRDELLRRKYFGMAFAGMSSTLWMIQNDRLPPFDSSGGIQFNLQRNEEPIFSVGKVTFAEEQTYYTGTRGYGGLSLPIGAGAYYHMGASQRRQVAGLVPLDVGGMLITSRTLYFGGERRTMRISLADVVRYEPYVDGVGVCEASGPPQSLRT